MLRALHRDNARAFFASAQDGKSANHLGTLVPVCHTEISAHATSMRNRCFKCPIAGTIFMLTSSLMNALNASESFTVFRGKLREILTFLKNNNAFCYDGIFHQQLDSSK